MRPSVSPKSLKWRALYRRYAHPAARLLSRGALRFARSFRMAARLPHPNRGMAAVDARALAAAAAVAWDAGFAAAMSDAGFAAATWDEAAAQAASAAAGGGWQDVGAEDLDAAGAASAELMLLRTDLALLENCTAECRNLAKSLATSPNIYAAVQLYVRMKAATSCRDLLPLARDVVVSHAAVAVGVQDRQAFVDICRAAFRRCGSPQWSDPQLSSQLQGSWAKTYGGIQGTWMSRRAQGKLRHDAAAATAASAATAATTASTATAASTASAAAAASGAAAATTVAAATAATTTAAATAATAATTATAVTTVSAATAASVVSTAAATAAPAAVEPPPPPGLERPRIPA